MKFYYLKIKYQPLSQSMIEDQKQTKQYRIKPNQFKREDIIIFDIPASQQPYRIPGTHIGILSDIALNPNKQLNNDHLDMLEQEITHQIEQIKQISSDSRSEDYQFDLLQLPCSNLGHKQQMILLNELVSLRSVIRKKTGFQNQWIEILYDAYRAVNISGFGYHKDEDTKIAQFQHHEPQTENLQQSINHSIVNPNRNSSILQDISINQNMISQNNDITYDEQISQLQDNNNVQKSVNFEDQNVPKPTLIQRETSPTNSPDRINLSGVRPPREYVPGGAPLKYEDQHKLTLSQFAMESQALKDNVRQESVQESKLTKIDPMDPKFSHIASKYDKYETASEKSLADLKRAEYESQYRQEKVRGEIVHFDRDFVQINREAVIGANEYVGESGVQSRLAKSQNENIYNHSIDQHSLQQRIQAQKLAQKAMNGDNQAFKELRELSEMYGKGKHTQEEIVRDVNQQMLDDGIKLEEMDFMKYDYNSNNFEMDQETRQNIVDQLVCRICSENPSYYDSLCDTAPEVNRSKNDRPKTARSHARELDDFSNYEHVDSQKILNQDVSNSRPLSADQEQRISDQSGEPISIKSVSQESMSKDVSQDEVQNDIVQAPRPKSKKLQRTITKKAPKPPNPEPQPISFDDSGMRSFSTTINGKSLILPSVTEAFKQKMLREKEEFEQSLIDDAQVGDILSVNKSEKTYQRDFCAITDSIFQELLNDQLSIQLNQAGMLLAKEAGINIE